MAKSNLSNIKLGIFVTIALILFTISIYTIGNRQFMFGSTFALSSEFRSVNGLQVGNNVRYAGISVGSVEGLVLLNDSTIRVDMILDNTIQEHVKKDASATITTDGLVGNMIVNISPGKGNRTPVNDGDKIVSYSGMETSKILNTLGSTTENIALLASNLLEITDNINRGEGSIAKIINDPQMAQDLQLAIKSLRVTSEGIASISDEFQESIDDMKKGEGLLGYLMTDTTFKTQIAALSGDLDTLINYRVTPIISNLQSSSDHIVKTSEELSKMMEDLDLSEGVAGVLLKDSLAAKDILEMIDNLNDGTHRFNESMKALQHNFLFRGFFKKREKKRLKELEEERERQSKLKTTSTEVDALIKN